METPDVMHEEYLQVWTYAATAGEDLSRKTECLRND